MSLFYALAFYISHILAGLAYAAVNPLKPAHDSDQYGLLGPQMAPHVAREPVELKDPLYELSVLLIKFAFVFVSYLQRVIRYLLLLG
jgi:hypothetical protein